MPYQNTKTMKKQASVGMLYVKTFLLFSIDYYFIFNL